jgi:hypothetical protein
LETIKRLCWISAPAAGAIAGMVAQVRHLACRRLRTRESPAAVTIGIPRLLVIASKQAEVPESPARAGTRRPRSR